MAEIDMDKIQDQLNAKLAGTMAGIKARVEAAQQTLYLESFALDDDFRLFNADNWETFRMTRERWEILGKPASVTVLIVPGDDSREDPQEPAPEVKDPLSKIDRIKVMPEGCTEVYFTNGGVVCSADPHPYSAPSLRGEQYEVLDPFDEHVTKIYSPEGFDCCHVVFEDGELCSEILALNKDNNDLIMPNFPSLRSDA